MLSLQYLLRVLLSQLKVTFCLMVLSSFDSTVGPKPELPKSQEYAFLAFLMVWPKKKATLKK
jgi:hypothetical protein